MTLKIASMPYQKLAATLLAILCFMMFPCVLGAQTPPDAQPRSRPRVLERVFPRHKSGRALAPPRAVGEREKIQAPQVAIRKSGRQGAINASQSPKKRTLARPTYGSVATRAEAPTTGPRPITRWPTGQKLVALTYDDGPNPQITPRLLALLQSKGARATFFLLGDSVRAYPNIVKQISEAGMEIGNHSDTHRQFTKLSEDGIRDELRRNEERIKSLAPDAALKVMRPPYGAYNASVMRVAEQMGYRVILWDVDTNDWRKRTSEQMVSFILAGARDGSIVLMHDRYETTLQATARIIDELSARGYRFVTLSELLAQPRRETSP